MKIFYASQHANHSPKQFYIWGGFVGVSPDLPERAENIREALKADGQSILEAPDFGLQPIAAVHTPDYLDYLRVAWQQFQEAGRAQMKGLPFEPGPEVHPLIFPVSGLDYRYPTSITGRAGFHATDMWMPICENTWEAVTASANLAVAAADAVLSGDRRAYALCRPSGHHAFANKGGGNCYLNNTAIAARYLRRGMKRVAVVDIDVHHGNGTQGVFYDRADVLFVSLHCDPDDCYPFYAGYDAERGTGEGHGYNINLPLPPRSGDARYLEALETACQKISSFAPDALVVSLGVDAHEDDLSQGLALTSDGFKRIGARLAALGLPTVLVQEGGYNLETIGTCVSNVLGEFD